MRRQLNQEYYATTCTSKVLKIIPTCCSNLTPHAIMYGHKISSKLDEITNKLHLLVEDKNILCLSDNIERSIRRSRRLEETSLVNESSIVGRQKDKETLLLKLLGNEPFGQNIGILSIIGIGGIGKTTLARVLYNEKNVVDHFELMAWVCVSDEFDVFSISKIIYQAVGGDDREFANLNLLQVALREKLLKKRFLLVLDDVWNENYKEWELLQRPFVVGASGSRIILTTRKTMVASMVDSVEAYPLELLSNEEALSLFAQNALGEQNFDSHSTLRLYGEGIVKKCGGLPLALVALGRVLRTKSHDEEWEELLNNEIWNLQDGHMILPALRLSYNDLPSHLKQMFAYCSLFSKDYLFGKDELVLMWMAEGFLSTSNDNKSMESLGCQCFDELTSRLFFQHSSSEKTRFTMHDLMNDLAMSVAGEFFFRLENNVNVYGMNEALEKYRHFSIIRQEYGAYGKFNGLQRARHLRTFLAVSKWTERWQHMNLSSMILLELLPQLRFLRVLSITNCSIRQLPQSIGSFKHMRYLNFSDTDITCLPEEVSDLYNLQSLLVNGCYQLSRLSNNFGKLINLRHLEMGNTPLLNKIPLGIGGLTSLQTLSKVIIEHANGFKLSDLKGLLHLQGHLSIKGLQKVINATQSRETNLQQKKGLDDVEMEWSNVFDYSRNERIEYEVLEGLRPHVKLRNLKICSYGGIKFPNWVGDPSFVWLTQLALTGCRNCTHLPTLGHLPSLRELSIGNMKGVKTLGSELLGTTNSFHFAFPSLEVLEFKDMQGWEIWSTNGGNNDGTNQSFPCLRDVTIVNCPKLAIVSIGLIPSLQNLYIAKCSKTVLRSMCCVSSSRRRLTMSNIIGLTHLHEEVLEHIGVVEDLFISQCDELRYLWELNSKACKSITGLRMLEVDSCKNLVSTREKVDNLQSSIKSVGKVNLFNCERLKSYDCPDNVESLVIWNCPSITSLTFPAVQEHPSTLKTLYIGGCENLESTWLIDNFLSLIESFDMEGLPNFRLFSQGCFIYLTTLRIVGCDIEFIPENGFGFLPLLCLRYFEIKNAKNLKSFPHQHFPSLKSLEVVEIRNCPSMDYSFPCGLWPPNLSTLRIGGLKKPMTEWGQQNFPPSLVQLRLHGENSGVVSFADVSNHTSTSTSILLPSSLTSLEIRRFMDVESLAKGLQHLTCLQKLGIVSCPKVRDLPETLLPSLSRLWVDSCMKLGKRCNRGGNYWPLISHIPEVHVFGL